jgi:hypothetical protein
MSKTKLSEAEKKQHARDAHNAWVAAHRKRVSEISMKWTNANKERAMANYKAWTARNRALITVKHKAWREDRFEKLTGRRRPKICDMCRRHGRRMHYDHDHKTGLFRGWLCHGCNLALGGVEDRVKTLRKLADYLDAYKASLKVRGKLAKAQKAYAIKYDGNAARSRAKRKKVA